MGNRPTAPGAAPGAVRTTACALATTACALAGILAPAGCGTHASAGVAHPSAAAPGRSTPPASAHVTAHDPHAPSVTEAPRIGADGRWVLVSGASVTGHGTYPLPGGIRAGGTLAIAVNCQGAGRVDVQVTPAGVSFPLRCEEGKVLPALNEMLMSKARSTASLRFTADPGVTWSFAAGWDPAPPERR
ncbi:hypothetical protein [Streptomyces sp. NPDC004065]|uniref:hypothetical protein n=1 Tax=Streptomyces sp. NPDC004065 TaxID=3364689 RepID=UPI00384C28E1